jgi:hypothetical protein
MRRFRLPAFCLVLGLSVTIPSPAAESNVSMRWALGAMDSAEAAAKAISKDTELQSGTRLKFMLEPESPCSVYLILLDAEDKIHELYRQSNSADADRTDPDYIPPGSHWFELDDAAGRETFFLLASIEPLADLEKLLDRHAAASAEEQGELGSLIVAEIRKQHKEHRQFARPVEKPVMIGGQTRDSGGTGIDHLAVEVSAEQFYGKTITIDH